jgi:hypothetical protein
LASDLGNNLNHGRLSILVKSGEVVDARLVVNLVTPQSWHIELAGMIID